MKIDDHGVEWTRLAAGREWARIPDSGHTCIIITSDDPTTNANFGWMVVNDATQAIQKTGSAPTRPEARKASVFALGGLLGIEETVPSVMLHAATNEGLSHETPPALRKAAAVILVALAFVAAVGLALVARAVLL